MQRAARDAYMLSGTADGNLSLDDRLSRIEKALIKDALNKSRGNRSKAARLLKINRTTLLQKMLRLGLADSSRKGAKSQRTKK